MSVDRKAVRQRIDQVRQVLLANWDPLQVGGSPALSDEYDSCLAKIMKALDTGDAERIVDALLEIEDGLGVGPVENRAELLPVARRLLALPHA